MLKWLALLKSIFTDLVALSSFLPNVTITCIHTKKLKAKLFKKSQSPVWYDVPFPTLILTTSQPLNSFCEFGMKLIFSLAQPCDLQDVLCMPCQLLSPGLASPRNSQKCYLWDLDIIVGNSLNSCAGCGQFMLISKYLAFQKHLPNKSSPILVWCFLFLWQSL